MRKNKIFNPKFALALGIIVILAGAIMVTELNKRASATTESSSNWNAKPVVVNIQVDLSKKETEPEFLIFLMKLRNIMDILQFLLAESLLLNIQRWLEILKAEVMK